MPGLLTCPEDKGRSPGPQAQRAPMPAHRPPLVPWEPLACMERFLFFTSLLQHLSFSVPTGQPRPSGHGVFAFLVTPSPYQLCALPC